MPAPGTVPGITLETAHALIEHAHRRGCLAMTAIGTSQEGADVETIRRIALLCKMVGADIHHIGDTGVPGMALPQNILAYSIAIRGDGIPTGGWPLPSIAEPLQTDCELQNATRPSRFES